MTDKRSDLSVNLSDLRSMGPTHKRCYDNFKTQHDIKMYAYLMTNSQNTYKNLETYFDTDEVIVDYDNRLHPQHKLSGQVIIKNGEGE